MNDSASRILGMIGLAKKAGKIVCGTDAVIEAITSGDPKRKPALTVCASDASERTKKQLADKCAYHSVTLITVDVTKDELALSVGKKDGQMSACAITDRGIAEKIILLGKG